MFLKPVNSRSGAVPLACRCLVTCNGDGAVLLCCSMFILSLVGGAASTLEGGSGAPSLLIATVPELETSIGACRFCGIGVAYGLCVRCTCCPLRFLMRFRAAGLCWTGCSAQSGVCVSPGVPCVWSGLCGCAQAFCSMNCSCANRSFCAETAARRWYTGC